jgi:hypothetical protein
MALSSCADAAAHGLSSKDSLPETQQLILFAPGRLAV